MGNGIIEQPVGYGDATPCDLMIMMLELEFIP
jgi:hypothetical protein